MIRLVDFRTEGEENVQFGTCELCFSSGVLDREFYVFEDDNGEQLDIECGYWSWGYYTYEYEVENVVRFGDFINRLQIKDLESLESNFAYIHSLYKDLEERGR